MLSPEAHGAEPTRRIAATRRCARLLALSLMALPLAACGNSGFHPLHGPTANGQLLDERLEHVDIATIPSRVGQRIRNELVFQRDRGGAAEPEKSSRLEVTIKETVVSTLVERTGTSSGQIYQLEASYKLIDVASKKVLFEARSLGRAGFDRVENIYSNVRAREDAENRAARTIASDIKTRLSAYLSGAS